jgi:hypothetical protein
MTWKKYRTVQTPAFSGEISAIRYERNWDKYGEVRPRLSPCRLTHLKPHQRTDLAADARSDFGATRTFRNVRYPVAMGW